MIIKYYKCDGCCDRFCIQKSFGLPFTKVNKNGCASPYLDFKRITKKEYLEEIENG